MIGKNSNGRLTKIQRMGYSSSTARGRPSKPERIMHLFLWRRNRRAADMCAAVQLVYSGHLVEVRDYGRAMKRRDAFDSFFCLRSEIVLPPSQSATAAFFF